MLSLIWYYFPKYGGVHWFTGPIPTIEKLNTGSLSERPSTSADSTELKKAAVARVSQQEAPSS